jgi:hypothetical protein
VKQWDVFEATLTSTNRYSNSDKYRNVTLNATFAGPAGARYTVPGFWDGGSSWRIRFAPNLPGRWSYTIESNDDQLDARQNDGAFIAEAQAPDELAANPNYRGFLKVSAGRRYLTYNDGTPFFWLGDTIWDANSKKMAYATDFKEFIDNRRQKKFSVIQLHIAEPRFVASELDLQGCRPPRYTGCNEAGYVYKIPSELTPMDSNQEFAEEINPESFQNLDRRLKYIVDSGMIPYIVFGWDKDFERLSLDSLKPYVRYIVARYQALNVIWCVAGEEYRLKDKSKFKAIGAYLREIDGAVHVRTIHGWGGELAGESWVDFISANAWAPPSAMREIMLREFRPSGLPYAMTESRYDGNEPTAEYRVRSYAWEAMAAGAFGYTYGADGVWDWGATDRRFPDPRARLDIPSAFEMKHMGEFFSAIEWWKLAPDEMVTDRGHALVEPDKQYVVWLDGGGSFTLGLPARQRTFSMLWLDPVRGTKSALTGITTGGKQKFSAPFNGDAVFYLKLDEL